MKKKGMLSWWGGICIALFGGCHAQNAKVSTVDAVVFKSLIDSDKDGVLLDVRHPEEFNEAHLKGAKLMDWLDAEGFKESAAKLDTTKTLYVYCRSGRRSNDAAHYLANQGFKVVDLKGGILAWKAAGLATTTLESDVFRTEKGRTVEITFIKHGTLMVDVDGYVIHIDPVTMFGTDYCQLPQADLILVTHEHADHFDKDAIALLTKMGTTFLSNATVAEQSGASEAMQIGESRSLADGIVSVTATAAYNNSEGHENFHPKGRDVGFLIDVDDLRIYVAGDTEDIPEMADLKDVDIAFLPVNQPYTMTPEQCVKAMTMFAPKMVYPYHYGETDLSPIVKYCKQNKDMELRIRQLQ